MDVPDSAGDHLLRDGPGDHAFLPGDSLLFAAGTFAARGSLDVHMLFLLLAGAAIAGDTANYWIGAAIGPRAFSGKYRLLNQRHLQRTHEFYERHGGKTIVLARFIPIIRTFAPFVAGIGAMNYPRFIIVQRCGRHRLGRSCSCTAGTSSADWRSCATISRW